MIQSVIKIKKQFRHPDNDYIFQVISDIIRIHTFEIDDANFSVIIRAPWMSKYIPSRDSMSYLYEKIRKEYGYTVYVENKVPSGKSLGEIEFIADTDYTSNICVYVHLKPS